MGENIMKKYLRLEREFNRLQSILVQRENAAVNMGKDAALMAASQVLKLGPGRAKAFCEAFDTAMLEMLHMCADEVTNTIGPDGKPDQSIEYTRHKIDSRIKAIVGEENFEPFEVRYCWNNVTTEMQKPVVINHG